MEVRHHVSHPVGVGRLMYVGDDDFEAQRCAPSRIGSMFCDRFRTTLTLGGAVAIYYGVGKRKTTRGKAAIGLGALALGVAAGFFAA